MRSAGLILLGILFIRCQLSIGNSCFSECMTASLLRYSNESVCSDNCFACVTDIAPRLLSVDEMDFIIQFLCLQ